MKRYLPLTEKLLRLNGSAFLFKADATFIQHVSDQLFLTVFRTTINHYVNICYNVIDNVIANITYGYLPLVWADFNMFVCQIVFHILATGPLLIVFVVFHVYVHRIQWIIIAIGLLHLDTYIMREIVTETLSM